MESKESNELRMTKAYLTSMRDRVMSQNRKEMAEIDELVTGNWGRYFREREIIS